MNAVFKLMAFSVMLNFATGIMLTALPVFQEGFSGGLPGYSSDFDNEIQDELGESISPAGELEDRSNTIDRVLDVLTLGFITKFLRVIDQYMFGFVNVMHGVFGSSMENALRTFLFGEGLNPGILKSVITFGYIFGAFTLWTGRNINE